MDPLPHVPTLSTERRPREGAPPSNLVVPPERVRARRRPGLVGDVLIGAAAGLAGMAVTGAVDRLLGDLLGERRMRRRPGVPSRSAHERAARSFARRVSGSRRSEEGKAAFSALYGVGWGIVYALVRRRAPRMSRLLGAPFAVPFFLACDGAIAPRLGFGPPLGQLPWQLNAKELGNHVAWTAGAELFNRGAQRLLRRRGGA